MNRFLIPFLLLCNCLNGQFSLLDIESREFIEREVNDYVEENDIVGISIGIIKNGEYVYSSGFGFSDQELNIKATENTVYRLASVSKAITGMLAVKAKNAGQINFDLDIRNYVPEYPIKPQGSITMHDLLSHQSGIIHYSGTASGQYCNDTYDFGALENYIDNHWENYDPLAALDIFKNQKICFTPGDHFQYTTWGFCLAGAVLERATNKTYWSHLYDEMKIPFNLETFDIELQAFRPYPNEAKGYEFDQFGNLICTPSSYYDYSDVSYKTAAGGLKSSVVDLTKLFRALVNRQILSESELLEWYTQRIPNDGENPYYGYGINSGVRNGNILLSHSGSQAQTATLVYFSPDNRNGIMLISNTRGVSLWDLARKIYDFIPQTITSLSENSISKDVKLYPNPAKDFIQISVESSGKYKVELYNNLGSFRKDFNSGVNIDIGNLTPGLYYARIINNNNDLVAVKRFVKE